jgi:23S rRNA-/tRNA-specific pseudouridylate synthase
VKKTYLARVHGYVMRPSFAIDSSIARKPVIGGLRAVVQEGLSAHIDVDSVRPYSDGTTLIRAYPRTGRTNQIRLHMQSVGHPVKGDRAYGQGWAKGERFSDPNDRLYLFAHALKFPHPVTEETMAFRAEPSEWFTEDQK